MAATPDHDLLKKAAAVVGAVFLLVGILGFIPGITNGYGDMEVAGPDSGAKLFGLFQVSVLHNIVHLAFGAFGLYAAKAWTSARLYLVGGGIVYLALWLYGLLIDLDGDANFIPVNTPTTGCTSASAPAWSPSVRCCGTGGRPGAPPRATDVQSRAA